MKNIHIKEEKKMKLLIKQGRVLDPLSSKDEITDLLIENGKIIYMGSVENEKADQVIDAKGFWVVPGLIDVHVHLREPGFEYKETIETGSKSAARGGFTTICCMPNTKPIVDNRNVVEYIKKKALQEAIVNVIPIGSITKGQQGIELAEIENMAAAGIGGISEDGQTVMNTALLKKAMKIAKELDIPVLSHCEDIHLVQGGALNEGEIARKLGIRGISSDSEDIIVARDIILGESTGARLHLCHMSTKGSVQLIKEAKNRGANITAEVCPHHFTLTDEAALWGDTNTKMNPPLRSREDLKSILQALEEGIIEIIATDHAPHSVEDKDQPYEKAAFGIIGLETAVALGITELVNKGRLTPLEFIEKMTVNPAKMLKIDKGTLLEGKIADITVIDPEAEYEINIDEFVSKSKNSPFHGKKVKGKVKYTIVSGKVVYKDKPSGGSKNDR
jgi:dihydroorotase